MSSQILFPYLKLIEKDFLLRGGLRDSQKYLSK